MLLFLGNDQIETLADSLSRALGQLTLRVAKKKAVLPKELIGKTEGFSAG